MKPRNVDATFSVPEELIKSSTRLLSTKEIYSCIVISHPQKTKEEETPDLQNTNFCPNQNNSEPMEAAEDTTEESIKDKSTNLFQVVKQTAHCIGVYTKEQRLAKLTAYKRR